MIAPATIASIQLPMNQLHASVRGIGIYEPTSGRVWLDDVLLADLSKEWLRDQTGYVTQESFLFNTTVRENLQVAKADAGDDEIWTALEAANAADFDNQLERRARHAPR
ncbi:MAG: ATP-binding cassette domain-containing protein [Verrucomicrobia bacterium]|nr:ATP-binding cassette domain-containing protein [Verrucomicrobiota bacterium]